MGFLNKVVLSYALDCVVLLYDAPTSSLHVNASFFVPAY